MTVEQVTAAVTQVEVEIEVEKEVFEIYNDDTYSATTQTKNSDILGPGSITDVDLLMSALVVVMRLLV